MMERVRVVEREVVSSRKSFINLLIIQLKYVLVKSNDLIVLFLHTFIYNDSRAQELF